MSVLEKIKWGNVQILGEDWTIGGIESVYNYLLNADIPNRQLSIYIEYINKTNNKSPLRINKEIYGYPYTVAVYPETKQIYLGSEYLSCEFLLIRFYDQESKLHYINEEVEQTLAEIKLHIEKVGIIPPESIPTDTIFYTATSNLTNLMQLHEEHPSIDTRTFELVDQLAVYLNEYKQSFFEKITDFGLSMTASFAVIRVYLLKFLAVLTCLDHDKSGSEVKRLLLEAIRKTIEDTQLAKKNKLKGQMRALPWKILIALKLFYKLVPFIPSFLLASTVRKAVKITAKRFIAGENITQALITLEKLAQTNRDATLDQLGELVVSKSEADHYMNMVLEVIDGLATRYPNIEYNASGIPKAHVSVKVTALAFGIKDYALEDAKAKIQPRLKAILLRAKESNVFINIDAEHYHYRNLVFDVWADLIENDPDLQNFRETGIVIQAYLRDSHEHFDEVLSLAKRRNLNMPIRLVKGAYWDAETIEARAHNFHSPQFLNKEETDIRFRQLILKTLDNAKAMSLAVASHNIHDHCWAEAVREALYPNANIIEHQCLHMTYEALSTGLAKMNWVTRNYVPVGDLLVGMAYLVRRIMENSSQVGILTIMRSHKKLDRYTGPLDAFSNSINNATNLYDSKDLYLGINYHPASPFRPYLREHEAYLNTKWKEFKSSLSKREYDSNLKLIHNNFDPTKILGSIQFMDATQASTCLDKLNQTFQSEHWFITNTLSRMSIIMKAAQIMHQQRLQLSFEIMVEAGKTLSEALADVDEAIDFINFYTRQFLVLNQEGHFVPKGLSVAIAPWNFPLAIPCGMMVAPLICGNVVALKSSEKTPLIAQKLVEIFWQAGVPREVLQHLVGYGYEIGDTITAHKAITNIIFTGSLKTGQHIYERSNANLINFKTDKFIQRKVITEMGGKNAIIVTNNCELDETISGILYASFAHAGQKCSACSRVIIDNEIKSKFIERFRVAASDIQIGGSDNFATVINPIIAKEDKQRILVDIENAINEANQLGGVVHLNRSQESSHPLVVGPVIIEANSKRLKEFTYCKKEIFAPVVHVIGYDTLEEAVAIFNDTDFGLTGGIYGQSNDDLEYLQSQLNVGNIYINRPNTGARVGIEPFGGFKLSGTGPKAGGRDYLRSFVLDIRPSYTDQKEEIELGAGSDYLFFTPNPSQLTTHSRIKKTVKVLKSIIIRFEHLTGIINEAHKTELKELASWIESRLEENINSQVANHYTPGQINYDKCDQLKKRALFICYNTPDPFVLNRFFISVATGLGCLVVCRTQKAYSFWSETFHLLQKYGFSKNNIEVVFASPQILKKALNTNSFEAQFIDANTELINEVLALSVEHENFKFFMRSFHSRFEGVASNDFDLILSQLTHTRSFAINTMRHGAPLELNEVKV